jgi:uncharacterized protein YnzC (UPF0291/DUF896 family)
MMLHQDKLNRINQLAKKAKESGLTLSEAKEQKELRAEYLKGFRNSFKNQLHSVTVVDEEGTDVTPEALKESKKRNNGNTH